MKVEDEYLDVLQNIEFGIIAAFRADPSLLDLDAKDAVAALIRHYRAEHEQHSPPDVRLGDKAQRVFDSVLPICEWGVGALPYRRNWGPAGRSKHAGGHRRLLEAHSQVHRFLEQAQRASRILVLRGAVRALSAAAGFGLRNVELKLAAAHLNRAHLLYAETILVHNVLMPQGEGACA